MHKCRHTRLPHTHAHTPHSPNDMRCCNPLWSCWTRRTPNQNQHKDKLGTCIEAEIVASCCKQFDLIEGGSKVTRKKDEYVKVNFDFDFSRFRIRLHVVLCRVCKPQLIVPHAKGHAVWQCQPGWRRQVWRRTSQSVSNALCMCVCMWGY